MRAEFFANLRSQLNRKTFLGLFLLAWLGSTQMAWGFVCTRVTDLATGDSGPSKSWFSRDLQFSISQAGTATIEGTLENDVIREAFETWVTLALDEEDMASCDLEDATDMTVSLTADSMGTQASYDLLAQEDNENLVVFHDEVWPYPGSEDILALATTTARELTGKIVDADIEFNTAHITFLVSPEEIEGADVEVYDLLSVAVHEVGHVFGFEHPQCRRADEDQDIDGPEFQSLASDLPVCDDFEAESRMYWSVDSNKPSVRSLTCDDARGMVFKYPASGVSGGRFGDASRNGYCDGAASDACGYCAQPGVLLGNLEVSVFGSDPGGFDSWIDIGCGQMTPVGLAPWLLLLLSTYAWRRRDTM